MKLKTTIRESIVALLALVFIVGVAYAGSLTPSTSTVTPQSYTLGDLYNKVTNINYSPTAHTVSTTSSPLSSFYTLTDIYGKLDTEGGLVVPGNIRSGVTMFGVTGNYDGSTSGAIEWSSEYTPPVPTNYWSKMRDYCSGNVDGRTGWRLPTLPELQTGLTEQFIMGIPHGFSTFSRNYWGNEKSATEAYMVGFDGRSIFPLYTSKTTSYSVMTTRCVR